MLLFGAELSSVDKRRGGHHYGSFPSRVNRGGLDGALGPQGMLQELLTPPTAGPEASLGLLSWDLCIYSPQLTYTATAHPGPERRACSLPQGPILLEKN